MATDDHERLADELGKESDRLADESARLEGEIKDVRADWRAKQNDPAVPGAVESPEERAGEDAGDQAGETEPSGGDDSAA